MCGRFVLTSPPQAVHDLFRTVEKPDFPPRYNIAPSQPIPVVLLEGGERHIKLMRWGLVPSWVKDPRTFTLLFNARADSVLDKPSFRNAMKRRRCLISSDGFYEWQALGANKKPFFIHPAKGGPIAFAGLYETWEGPNGEVMDTACIITTEASGDLRAIHDRMPVVIQPEAFDFWLDCSRVDAETAAALLVPAPRGFFDFHEISTAVNRAAADGPHLVVPVGDAPVVQVAEPAPPTEKPTTEKPTPAKPRKKSTDDGQGSLF